MSNVRFEFKKEIEERIAYEIFKYQDFVSNNQQNYLYCLMDEDEFIYGVYESFDLAYDNLKQKVHEDLNDDFFLKVGINLNIKFKNLN